MKKIEPLSVNDPNYEYVLAASDSLVETYNKRLDLDPTTLPLLHPDSSFMLIQALTTWKKIAEERQEVIDYHNQFEMKG